MTAELPPAFCDALAGRRAGRSLIAIVAVKSLLAPWLESEANGRVVHRKGFAKTYPTNIVEGVGHS